MPLLTKPVGAENNRRIIVLCIVASTVAVVLSLLALLLLPMRRLTEATSEGSKSNLSSIKGSGILRVGYGGFPPYTIIDPKETDINKRVSGFSVDLVKEIALRMTPPIKVEWVLFSWETIKTDMLSGKFDLIADPVFQTIPRATDLDLCEPYSYFGIAVALVKQNDNRFNNFQDLNRPDIIISLAAGWTSSEYARQHLTKPQLKDFPVTGDAVSQLDEVLFGRADVALNDVPTVIQYVKAHPDKVKALWLEAPPSTVPGGFVVKKTDYELKAFLDSCIRILLADGTLRRLDEKWKTYGYLPIINTSPGKGIIENSIFKPKLN